MLEESGKSWKLLEAKFTLEGEIRFCGTVPLRNEVIQIVLGFCGEIGTVSTIQCTSRTTLLVPYNIVSCSLVTTIFT